MGQFIPLLVIVVGIPLGLALLMYVIAPLVVWRKQTINADPGFEPTESDQLTPEMVDFLSELIGQFSGQGFEVVANVKSSAASNTQGVQVLLANPATGDTAVLLASVAKTMRNLVFAIRTIFADGRRVESGVNRDIGVFPKKKGDESLTFSWVRDAETLCELHRRRMRGRPDERSARESVPTQASAMDYLRRQWDREIGHYIRAGYLREANAAGVSRMTLKGAFLSTWKLLPPFKGWRIRKRDAEAVAAWNKLGMADWDPVDFDATALEEISSTNLPAAGEVAASASAPPTSAPAAIGYEARLLPGEIRSTQTQGGLVVHVGGESVGSVLGRQWLTILVMTFFFAVAGLSLYRYWQQYQLYLTLPPAFGLPRPTPNSKLLLWGGLIAFDAWILFKAFRRTRSTTLVVAGRELRYANAPSFRRNGVIARHDLNGLMVIPLENGLRGRLYQLCAKQLGTGGRVQLLVGSDKERLESVRRSLAVALGIES